MSDPRDSLLPEPSTVAVPRPPPPPLRRRVVLVLAVLLFVVGFVSTAATPVLAAKNPLLLLMLEAPIRNLLLARHTPLLPYLLVGVSRRVLGATVLYLLGRWYGDAALRWFERHVGPSVRRAERFARVFGVPWVFFWPGPIVCMSTGAVGLPRLHFLVSCTLGCVGLVLVCRYAGDVFARPLDATIGFFQRHTLEASLVAVCLALAGALQTYRNARARAAAHAREEREAREARDRGESSDR